MRARKKLAGIIILILALLLIGNSNKVVVKAALQNKPGDNLSEAKAINLVYDWMQQWEDYEWGGIYKGLSFMDFDFDGEMELVVEYMGGSAGNRYSKVYEITKKGLVEYQQGFDINELSLYYDTKTKKNIFITKPYSQSGAFDRNKYLDKVSIIKGKLTDIKLCCLHEYEDSADDYKATHTEYYDNKGKISKSKYDKIYKACFADLKKMYFKTYEVELYKYCTSYNESSLNYSKSEIKKELKKSYDTFSYMMISKKMENLSGSIDRFVYQVIMKSYTEYMKQRNVDPGYNKFNEVIKKNYNGKLTNKIKSIISAENADGYKLYHTVSDSPAEIWKTSSDSVQFEAKNIFGSSLTSIELPVWKSKDKNNTNDFELQLAKNSKGEVFAEYCDAENDIKSEIIEAVKGKDSVYTITKEYRYFAHWGNKKPDCTITVIIKLKVNSKSTYGYNIIALNIK